MDQRLATESQLIRSEEHWRPVRSARKEVSRLGKSMTEFRDLPGWSGIGT